MPEVIEVKKYAIFLNKLLKNKYINNIKILKGRYKKYGPFPLYEKLKKNLPLKVIDIKTKGKFLYFVLEKNFYIFSTLGLSGGWVYKSNKLKKYKFPLKYKKKQYEKIALNHLNVQFKIDSGTLYYYDNLSFGTLKVVDKTEHLEEKLKTIASNITNNNTTFELFSNQINKTKNSEKEIGIVLMDQKVISGIGNYLRSDILWLSKISPFRKVKDLKKSDLKKLYKYSKSLSKEINVLPKNYGREFFVYDMKEDIYGNKIIKEPLYTGKNKRFIYWLPKIQV